MTKKPRVDEIADNIIAKMTFRQRLRIEAEERLDGMLERLAERASGITEGSRVNFYQLMRLSSGTQTKSLRYRLITELANEKVAELEQFYNRQMNLLEEDSDGE